MADTLLFGISAFVIVASALMVVLNRNPVYSALYLVLTLMGLAVVYWQLSAPFLAAVQVIVYAGAIMVLFTFVIMLLGEDKPMKGENKLGLQLPLGAFFSLCLVGIITYMVMGQPAQAIGRPDAVEIVPLEVTLADGTTREIIEETQSDGVTQKIIKATLPDGTNKNIVEVTQANGTIKTYERQYAEFGSVKALGDKLFTNYLFAFEATSVVLLIAMVGVVVLAKKRL